MGKWIHVFFTSVLGGGEWSASRPAALPPGKEPSLPIGEEAGLGPELVWASGEKIYPYRVSNSDPPAIQLYRLRHPGSLVDV
jgi:hypothetical protein